MPTTSYYTVNGQIIGESTDGVRTDYLTDALGNVTGTVNSAGALINTYAYKPSGARLAKTGVGADPRFQHVGSHGIATSTRKHAEEYMRRRHYANLPAVFTTPDPTPIPEDRFIAPYIYVKQNPTSFIDPSGLIALQLLAGMAGQGQGRHKPPGLTDCLKKKPPLLCFACLYTRLRKRQVCPHEACQTANRLCGSDAGCGPCGPTGLPRTPPLGCWPYSQEDYAKWPPR